MAVLKINTGSAWHTVEDGTLKVQSDGAWVSPSYLWVKDGTAWVDSGYRGYPVVPTGLAVNAWPTFEAVSFKWTAGVGGAAVDHYTVAINNETDTARVAEADFTTSPSTSFTQVVPSGKYKVYVKAVTAGGLESAWAGGLRIEMGKADASYYTTDSGIRPWSEAVNVNAYKDLLVGVSVPTHRAVQTVTYNIAANAGFTSVLSPYNNREIYRLSNNGQNELFSWLSESVNYTLDVADYWGNTGTTGMICRGTGWATGPASHVARAVGTITVNGYEMYNYQTYHSVPAVANGYW